MKTSACILLALVLTFGRLLVESARAADGTWSATTGGNWSDTNKWSAAIVADGADGTASFTANLGAAAIVTLDTPGRVIGNLTFADSATTYYSWTLAGTDPLTLVVSSGAPVITINNAASIISAPLAGTAGFTRNGTAALTLSGANTGLSGTITANAGPAIALGGSSTSAAFLVGHDNCLGAGPVVLANTANMNAFYGIGTRYITNAITLSSAAVNTKFNQQANQTNDYSGKLSGGNASAILYFDNTSANSFSILRWSNPANDFRATIYAWRGMFGVTHDGNFGHPDNLIRFDQTSNNGGLRFDAPNVNILHAFDFVSRFDLVANGHDGTLSGPITGSGGTYVIRGGTFAGGNSAGSVAFAGNNSMSCTFNVATNTTFIAASATALGSGATTVLNGGTVAFRNVGTYTGAGALNLNGAGVLSGGLGVGALQNLAGINTLDNSINLASTAAIGVTAGSLTLNAGINGAFPLTKVGPGTLTLNGFGSYSGATTVSAGTLALGPFASILSSPSIFLAPGSTFDISAGGFTLDSTQTLAGGRPGTPATDVNGSLTSAGSIVPGGAGLPATLTVSGGLSLTGGSLNFDLAAVSTPGSGVNDLLVATGALNLSGATTLNVNWLGGVPTPGTYTLITAGSLASGDASNLVLGGGLAPGGRISFALDTTTTPGTVYLKVTGGAASLRWTGAASSTWDINGAVNWLNGLTPDKFYNLDVVRFADGATTGSVDVSVPVTPTWVTISNQALAYTLAGAGSIDGSGGLTKEGSGAATLSTLNNFTGPVALNGGTVTVGDLANIGAASALGAGSSLAFDGATLNVTSGFTGSDRAVVLNTGGGALNADGYLTLAGPLSGVGLFTKGGIGTLTLTGANTTTNTTTISAGTLSIGDGGANGALGTGSIVNQGNLTFNSLNSVVVPGSISGAGVLAMLGSGSATLAGSNTFSGGTTISAGSLVVANTAGLGTSNVVINGGSLRFGFPSGTTNVVPNDITLPFGGSSQFQILGNPTTLTAVRLPGKLSGGAAGQIFRIADTEISGNHNGCVVLENPANNFEGILQVWRGVVGFTSDAALGNPANGIMLDMENNNGSLRFDADNLTIAATRTLAVGYSSGESIDVQDFTGTVACPISGTGILNKKGNGTLILSGASTFTNNATFNVGTVLVNGSLAAGGTVTVGGTGTLGGTGTIDKVVNLAAGGRLAPGASIGTLTINNDLNLSGSLLFEVNKALSPARSNDLVVVSTAITALGTGPLVVTNLGPALAVGDSFKLFSQPVLNGAALAVTGGGPGVTWTNRLEVDGSIAVLSLVNENPTNLTYALNGTNLDLSWPADHLGWRLQMQINSLSVGLSNNWADVPGSQNTTTISVPVNPANPAVFFRLVYP
jgi:fibronectin-binding autotransporter adhesin